MIPESFLDRETFRTLKCLSGGVEPGDIYSLSSAVCEGLSLVFRLVDNEEQALEYCAEILCPLGACGVESIQLPGNRGTLQYVNLGDTYRETILLRVDTGELSLGSWGDALESAEEEHAEESGEVRCAYCGEWAEGGPCHYDMGAPRNVRGPCECADPGCPNHGQAHSCPERAADVILYRVDMQDVDGVKFCEACAEDALASGVFSTHNSEEGT